MLDERVLVLRYRHRTLVGVVGQQCPCEPQQSLLGCSFSYSKKCSFRRLQLDLSESG